jgi:hypothetical protein
MQERIGARRVRHRWSWFAERGSATKVTLIVGLLGVAATLATAVLPVLTGGQGGVAVPPAVAHSSTSPVPSGVAATPTAGGSPTAVSPRSGHPRRQPATKIPDRLLINDDASAGTGWGRSEDVPQFKISVTGQCIEPDPAALPYSDGRRLLLGATGSGARIFTEALIVYRDQDTAEQEIHDLKAALDRCYRPRDKNGNLWRITREELGLPAESLRVSTVGETATGQPARFAIFSVVAQRGVAVVFYSDLRFEQSVRPADVFAGLEADAKQMLDRMCIFDPGC